MDQEQYLEGTPLGKIILRGIKKLVTEMTSTKFLLLVFIYIGIWQKFIQDFEKAIFLRLLKNVQHHGATEVTEEFSSFVRSGDYDLNAVASNLPPSTDLDALAERFKRRGYAPVVLPRK